MCCSNNIEWRTWRHWRRLRRRRWSEDLSRRLCILTLNIQSLCPPSFLTPQWAILSSKWFYCFFFLRLLFVNVLFVFYLHQCSLRLLPRFNLLFGFLLDQTSHLFLVSSLDHQSSLWSFPRSNLLIFSLLSAKLEWISVSFTLNLESQNLPLQSL
jgi:hypothetical protein